MGCDGQKFVSIQRLDDVKLDETDDKKKKKIQFFTANGHVQDPHRLGEVGRNDLSEGGETNDAGVRIEGVAVTLDRFAFIVWMSDLGYSVQQKLCDWAEGSAHQSQPSSRARRLGKGEGTKVTLPP